MTDQQAQAPAEDADDTTGFRIREERVVKPPPYDHNGGLFPYQFLHPTISDGYIFYPSGNRYPY